MGGVEGNDSKFTLIIKDRKADAEIQKGYVLTPEDWKYSTARNWINSGDDVISLDLEFL